MFWHFGSCLLNRSWSCILSISVLHSDLNQSSGQPNHKVKMDSKSRERLKPLFPMVDHTDLASMKLYGRIYVLPVELNTGFGGLFGSCY